MNTFDFRPHSGEAGSVDHLAASFLLARGINHGINLAISPPLEYLYYMAQVGIAVSPLSNNALFLDYKRNPFPQFFKRGLNVSLSTDDPLQFHFTQTPLIEEYAIAAQCWQLTAVDLSEVAQNSVKQSGFEHACKAQWLGPDYYKPGVAGNNISFSNVPDGRTIFRHHTWTAEQEYVNDCLSTRVRKRVSRESSAAMREERDYTKLTVMPLVPDETHCSVYPSKNAKTACAFIEEAVRMRHKYLFQKAFLDENTNPDEGNFLMEETILFEEGIFNVYPPKTVLCQHDGETAAVTECLDCQKFYCEDCNRVLHKPRSMHGHKHRGIHEHEQDVLFIVHSYTEFLKDYNTLRTICSNSETNSFAQQRLELLESRFNFHKIVNSDKEKDAMKFTKKDFYHICRVDTHIHAASAMCAPTLLSFIKHKFEHNGKDIVIKEGGITLEQEFSKLNIPIENFTLDSLNVSATATTFGQFDRFNSKYNPFGASTFRTLFLKKENDIEGRYFGELLRGELDKLEHQGNEQVEWRISIYGEKETEWDWLATWVEKNQLYSPRLRWMVQIPRLFHIFRQNELHSFAEMLNHIFAPLFAVTKDPSSNPCLHKFLCNLSGFDSVDNEDVVERQLDARTPPPPQWTCEENPPYAYYLYYLWANITSLNLYRESKGMNSFDFRPHSGASGSWEHLCASFLTAQSVSHGSNLVHNHCLQYLFYLCDVGISISPLSEAALHVDYMSTAFHTFFKRGLHVSLSTDNPLLLHTTPEPLIEEYSIASQMFRLDMTDMSEIAKNSVLQSGFIHADKCKWLGKNYWKRGVEGNDPGKSNLPNIRVAFRENNLQAEIKVIESVLRTHNLSNALQDTSMQGATGKKN